MSDATTTRRSRKLPAPTFDQLVLEQMATGPKSIGQIMEALARSDPERYTNPDAPWSVCAYLGGERICFPEGVEWVLSESGAVPILDTPEKAAAKAMKEADGCFDSWPDGEGRGYEIYDSILWQLPIRTENVVHTELAEALT